MFYTRALTNLKMYGIYSTCIHQTGDAAATIR